MNKFAMYGKLTACPGKREELVSLLLDASRSLDDMAGCELYLINESIDDPDAIWVTELWRDAEAHAASLQNEEVLAVIQRARPLIAGVEPVRLRPVGGKGIRGYNAVSRSTGVWLCDYAPREYLGLEGIQSSRLFGGEIFWPLFRIG